LLCSNLLGKRLLLNGPGRFSFDAGMGPELIAGLDRDSSSSETDLPGRFGAMTPAVIPLEASHQSK
jgi:hypothetical protein